MIRIVERFGRDNLQHSSPRCVLNKLELSNVQKRIVVHVQRRDGNLRIVVGDERFLDAVAADFPQ